MRRAGQPNPWTTMIKWRRNHFLHICLLGLSEQVSFSWYNLSKLTINRNSKIVMKKPLIRTDHKAVKELCGCRKCTYVACNIYTLLSIKVTCDIRTLPTLLLVIAVVDHHCMYHVCIAQVYAPPRVLFLLRVCTEPARCVQLMVSYSIHRSICWVFKMHRGLRGWLLQCQIFWNIKPSFKR